jgi:hypothetical protein
MAEYLEQLAAEAARPPRNRIGPLRLLTSGFRSAPDFIIIGAQKCGTTALFNYLEEHPGVAPALTKEIHFFDLNFERGLRWYRAHFPARLFGRRRTLHGEASPSYILHPLAPQRIRASLPGVRLIAIVRDPAERAHSHYQHNVRKGRERLPFAEALDREEERLSRGIDSSLAGEDEFRRYYQFSYLLRGIYHRQLERWFERFERREMLILSSDDLRRDPAAAFGRVLEFLGLAPFEPEFTIHHHYDYEPMDPALKARLQSFFAPHNRRLYELLGRDFGWDGGRP